MDERTYNPAANSAAGVVDEDWYQTADAIFKARMADYQSYGQPGGYASYMQEARKYQSNLDPLETMGYLNAQRAIDSNWEYAQELGKSLYNGGIGVVRDTLNGIRAARDYNIALLNEQAKAQGFERNPDQDFINALDNTAKAEVLQPYDVKQSASRVGQFGLDVAQGAGQLAGQMAVSIPAEAIAPGIGGLAMMVGQITGGQYEDLKAKGVDTKRAAEAAFANAMIQAPFERLSLTRLMRRVPAGSVLKKKLKMVLEDMATEGITEAIQQFPEEWAELWALNPDKSWKELQAMAAKKFPDTLQNALYAGLIGGVLGAGSRGIHIAVDRNIDLALRKELHDERVTTIESRINSIKQSGISPDYAGETVNANLNNATVLIDGGTLNAYAQRVGEEKAAEKLGVTVETIREAAEKGDTVEVNQGNFEALSASDPSFYQEVRDDLSFDANDMSNRKYDTIQANIERYSKIGEKERTELKTEVDKIAATMEEAGVPKGQIAGMKAMLTSFATAMRPDNPAQFIRDNALRFERATTAGSNAEQLAQTMFNVALAGTKTVSETYKKIKERKAKGEKPNKIKFINNSGVVYPEERIVHIANKHGITEAEMDDIDSHINQILEPGISKRKGSFHGTSILARIQGDLANYSVVLEFVPNGDVYFKTAAKNSVQGSQNWINEKSAKRLSPATSADPVSDGRSVNSIRQELGIVNPNGYLQTADPRARNTMSTRVPTAKKEGVEDAFAEEVYANYEALKRTPKAFENDVNALRKIDGLDVPAENAEEAAEQMIQRMVDNLLFLYNQVDPKLRDRAKSWYDGGRKMAEVWSERYGISPMAAAGTVAVLSPQKDWFTNVSLAERVLDCVYGHLNEHWSDEMEKKSDKIVNRTNKQAKVNVPALERAKGKTLKQLIDAGDYRAAAIWVRCYDECHNDRAYRVVSPEGGTGEYIKTDKGKNAVAAWGDYGAIAKAVSIAANPTATNVFYQLGDKHKVRNFYNNLYAPWRSEFATIDTHAVAAALLTPLAGTSWQVEQNFGGAHGASSSALTGISGTYPIYFEAYRRAAEKVGILPREMQSITWEAVRNMYPPSMKGGSAEQKQIMDLWKQADADIKAGKDAKEVIAETQKKLYNIGTKGANKLQPFAWENTPTNAVVGDTYDRSNVDITKFNFGDFSTIGLEVAPDPDNKALTDRWNKLSDADKVRVSREIFDLFIPGVLLEYDVKGEAITQLGGFEGATNPSFALEIQNPQMALRLAKVIGHAFNQNSMMIASAKKVEGTSEIGMISLKVPDGWGEKEVREFYDKLWEIKDKDGNRLVSGHSTVNGTMQIMNFSDVSDEVLMGKIKEVAPNFGIAASKGYSALIEKKDYGIKEDKQDGTGSDTDNGEPGSIDRYANNLRRQVAEELERKLAEAEGRNVSETVESMGSGNESGTGETETSGTPGLLGQETGGTGNRIEYNQEAENGQPLVQTPEGPRAYGAGQVELTEEDRAYIDALNRNDIDALREMVQQKARDAGFDNPIPEHSDSYHVRTKAAPKKTKKAYKIFYVNQQTGAPTALFVGGAEALPVGVWLDANDQWHFTATNGNEYVPSTKNPNRTSMEGKKKNKTTGARVGIPEDPEVRKYLKDHGFITKEDAKNVVGLAYRPGWHSGTLPFFPQGGKQREGSNYPNIHEHNQIVFEVEVPADKDWTEFAQSQEKAKTKNGTVNMRKADLQRLPTDGYYAYTTNPILDPKEGAWIISDSMKIVRALTQEEADRILAENGKLPQEWEQGELILSDYNLDDKEHSDAARKTIAPITYDGDGNVIPLSQRFDVNNPDVLYQNQEQTTQTKGSFDPFTDGEAVIKLFEGADASTVIHETGHYYIESLWREIASGRATEQQKADFEKLMKYCDLTIDQWAKLDTEGRRAAHERLAEAFETYIMEDKAPTRELRPVFKRFAEWLKGIYSAISRNRNAVPLTDEVREVFDRMLASEEDVEEMRRVEGYFEKLPDVITDNLSDATKRRIEDYILKAQDKAVEILTKERLANFSEDRKREIENFRNIISDEVRQEVANRPLYVAARQAQELLGGEKPASAKQYANLYLEEKMSDENEVKWEIVAEQNNMSPSELAQKLLEEPNETEAYNATMKEAVQKEFPDYYTEREQAEEATREAMYNDESGILLGVEQVLIEDFAARAAAQQRSAETARKLAMAKRQQAKVAAQKELAKMKLKDATNVNKFMRAERNCAVKSAEAMAKKDYETARHYKDMQAFNHAMVIESANLAKRKQQYDKFLRKLSKSKQKNWFSEQHWNQAMALFARMGIPNRDYDPTTRTESLKDYLDAMADWYYGFGEAPGWLLDETWPINDPKNMTFEDYETVIDLLEYIKTMDKAEKADNFFDSKMKYQEWRDQAIDNLNKLATKFTPVLGEKQTATLKEKFDSAYQTLDNFLEKMDGWHFGFFSRSFGDAIKHANDREFAYNEAYNKRISEAEKAWCPTKEALEKAAEKVYYEELGTSASKFVLTKMLMNLGNEGNARKLCGTLPSEDLRNSSLWVFPSAYMTKDEAIEQTKENLLEFLGRVLTQEDIAYAQAKIDAQGMYWSERAEMDRRTKGFTPKKVEAYPVTLTLANGETAVFRGGYFPLIRNGEMGSHPAGILPVSDTDPDQGRNVRTMYTDMGRSISRVEAAYPVDLSEGSEDRAMRAAIHDLCWRETMTEFRRILNDPMMFGMMKSKLGIADMTSFREMLEHAAQPNGSYSVAMGEGMFAQTAGWLRRKIVNSIVMLNFRINTQNWGNIFLYGNDIEGFTHSDTIAAIANSLSNGFEGRSYMEMWKFVDEKSAYMRERNTTPDITLADLREEGKLNEYERTIMEWGAKTMAFTDGMTARPVWCQAYYKKLNAGATEQEAIDFADTVIRRTLGSGRVTDVASLQRGTQTFKLFTAFQGFFNTQFNQWVREYNIDKRLWSEKEYKEMALRITSFVASKYLAACFFNLLLAFENPFGRDDDDEPMNYTKELLHYPMSLVGIFGQVANSLADNTLGIKSYGYRLSIIESGADKLFRTGKNVRKMIDGDFAAGLESLTDVAGIAAGVPAQMNRLFWNAYDIFANDMDPRLSDLMTRRPKRERNK